MRPVGSSLFMRWPEFGYGIRRAPISDVYGKPTRQRVTVQAWRGPREERDWPKLLGWGDDQIGDWPWIVLPPDTEKEWSPSLHAVTGA